MPEIISIDFRQLITTYHIDVKSVECFILTLPVKITVT